MWGVGEDLEGGGERESKSEEAGETMREQERER